MSLCYFQKFEVVIYFSSEIREIFCTIAHSVHQNIYALSCVEAKRLPLSMFLVCELDDIYSVSAATF